MSYNSHYQILSFLGAFTTFTFGSKPCLKALNTVFYYVKKNLKIP